jgi:hypothetical protein
MSKTRWLGGASIKWDGTHWELRQRPVGEMIVLRHFKTRREALLAALDSMAGTIK